MTRCRAGARREPAAILAVVVAVGARRLAISASFAQYHGRFGTEHLTGSVLGRAVAWSMVVVAAGFAWAVRALRRM